MAIILQDSFTQADNTAWDSTKWTIYKSASGVYPEVISNSGTITMTGSSATTYGTAVANVSALSDSEVLTKMGYDSAGNANAYIGINMVGITTAVETATSGVFIRSVLTSTTSAVNTLWVKVGNVATQLANLPSTNRPSFYWWRLRKEGNTVSYKVWIDGSSEPTSWNGQYDISSYGTLPAGVPALGRKSNTTASNNGVKYDDFSLSSLSTPIKYTAQVMTASADMPGGRAVPVRANKVTATPMAASAAMSDARVLIGKHAVADKDTYIDAFYPSGGGVGDDSLLRVGQNEYSIFIGNPSVAPGEVFAKGTLTLTRASTATAETFSIYRITAPWDELINYNSRPTTEFVRTITTAGGNTGSTLVIDVTQELSQANYGLMLNKTNSGLSNFYSSDSSTGQPVYDYSVVPAPVTPVTVHAQPWAASADMPAVRLGFARTIKAEPMAASAEFKDATVRGIRSYKASAAPLEASIISGDHEFARPITVRPQPLSASLEASQATVATGHGVIHNAGSMDATAMWVKPKSVNGQAILLNEVDDPYFRRVVTENPAFWMRMTETGPVLNNRVTNTALADVRGGVFVGRHNGPDGRASIYFDGTGMVEQREPGGTNADETVASDNGFVYAAYEFSIKTTKADQFILSGGDQVRTPTGQVSAGAGYEVFLKNGRLGIRRFSDKAGYKTETDEFVGFTNLADDQWHHIVIRAGFVSPVSGVGGTEFIVDNKLEIRRYKGITPFGFPDYIGSRPSGYIDGNTFPMLSPAGFFVGEMSEVVVWSSVLPSTDIHKGNYYAFMGYNPIAAAPMEASASFGQGRAKGNRKKALYLYWNGQDEIFQSNQEVSEMVSFDPFPYLASASYNRGPYPNTQPEETVTNIAGMLVYTKSIQMESPQRGIQYRDPVTDEPRLIDLNLDVDIDDFDVIFFKDWPDEGFELDRAELNYPGEKYRFTQQLLELNRTKGISLYVTNPRMAVDLGIVDRLEFVPTLKEHKFANIQGNALGYYDFGSATKFPWNIAATDGLSNGNATANGIGQTQNLSKTYLEDKAYFYNDTNDNNRFRVKAVIEGLTDLPAWMIGDAVFHVDSDFYGNAGVAYKYLKRTSGLVIGDEYIYNGSEIINNSYDSNPYNRYNGVWATPAGHVKAGTVVTTFGSKMWQGQSIIDNPYRDYATTIVLDRGDKLNGKPVGGRIFVNFTEAPTQGASTPYQVLPAPGQELPRGYPQETAAQREWDYSWTRTSLTSTAVSGSSQVTIILPNGTKDIVNVKDDTDLFATTKAEFFPKAYGPANLDMTARGLIWVASAPEIDPNSTVVRADPMEASAAMGDAKGIGHRQTTIKAQPMSSTANMPNVVGDKSGAAHVVALPFAATATFTQYGKRIYAKPLEASAEIVEPFDAVHTSGEQVTLVVYNFDAELYLKEET